MKTPDDAFEDGLRLLAEGKTVAEAAAALPYAQPEIEDLLSIANEARAAGGYRLSEEASRKLRAKFLHRAAELRETSRAGRHRILPAFPRVAITLGLVVAFALMSTGLVRASSGAVPGDQLYGFKRSWEGLRIFLSRQPSVQYMLASEFEQERLDEIDELLIKRRSAAIKFSGVVSLKQDGTWAVSGIPVHIPSTAVLPGSAILVGQPVLVTGITSPEGAVEAQRIDLLLPGAALPPLAPSAEEQQHELDEGSEPALPSSGADLGGNDQPQPYITYQFTGVVERMGASVWQINRQEVSVGNATIIGAIKVGGEIRFEGYYSPNGTLIATWIEAASNLRHDDGREDPQQGDSSGSDDDAESHIDGASVDSASSD